MRELKFCKKMKRAHMCNADIRLPTGGGYLEGKINIRTPENCSNEHSIKALAFFPRKRTTIKPASSRSKTQHNLLARRHVSSNVQLSRSLK